jgi:hypothetical protein
MVPHHAERLQPPLHLGKINRPGDAMWEVEWHGSLVALTEGRQFCLVGVKSNSLPDNLARP